MTLLSGHLGRSRRCPLNRGFTVDKIESIVLRNNKQLLDEVFLISRKFKVEVGVIKRNRRLRLITLTETLIILNIKKTESNNCFIIPYNKKGESIRSMIERILSFSIRHKMFSKFVPTLSFP